MIWVSKLKIRNFKSIENEEIELKKCLNILVGPNDAGKTNIIEALDLLLGDMYLPNFEPNTDHFFVGNEDRGITIEAELSCDNDELDKIIENAGSKLRVKYEYTQENGGAFEIWRNNQWERKFGKAYGYYWDFDKNLFFLRIKSLRNIMEIAPIRWKSPLRYFKEIIVKKAPREKLERVLKEIEKSKDRLLEIDEVKNILSFLLEICKSQTEIKNISISPAPTKYSDILNEMKILIDDGYCTEVTKKGLGTQNLLIISLFRMMAEYIRNEEGKSIIYGIDEPEIGLHPHSQRQLINSLKDLSKFSQVIITTHSDRLIDLCEADNIIRIVKEDNKTKKYMISLTPQEKKILEVHGRNLQEVFFAKRALIVEGCVEEGFFVEASKKIEENGKFYSFDYNSVSVVNGMGDTLWFFVKLLKSLNIPFAVVIDEDKLQNRSDFLDKLYEYNLISEEKKKNLEVSNEEILKLKLKEHRIFVLPPFEEVVSNSANEKTRKKIKKAVYFVRKHWGYETEKENDAITLDEIVTKDALQKLLKKNKRWRVGKAIAQELEYNEIPDDYIEVIKIVSAL